MGNKPSECNGERCYDCNTSLPPCTSFDDFSRTSIDRKVDTVSVYIFLGGKYYKPVGTSRYYCPDCFWKPKNDYIQKQEEERKKREEQRKKEEQERRERQKREEEERQRERERQEELKQREEEARQEAARQEALLKEKMKKEEERKRRAQEQLEFEKKVSKKKSLSEKFCYRSVRKEKEKFEHQMHVQLHKNSTTPTVLNEYDENTSQINDEYELWSEDLINDDDLEPEEIVNDIKLTKQVVSMVVDMQPIDDYIDIPWLKIVQTQMLNHFARVNSLSPMEVETLLYCLSCLCYKLSDIDHLYLTKMMCSLSSYHPLEYQPTSTPLDDDLPGRFLVMMLESGQELNFANTECMRQCLNVLASNSIQDVQLQSMIAEAASKFWSTYDRFLLLKKCSEMKFSFSAQKHILHLVQVYDILPCDVLDALESSADSKTVIKSLVNKVKTEPNMHLKDLVSEIKSTNLVEPATLDVVNDIMTEVNQMLQGFNIDLDYQEYLAETNLAKAKYYFRKCSKGNNLNTNVLSNALVTLCCAVQKSQGFCPRNTQLIALTLMIVSNNNSISRLLEVMTGEGKSTIIAMLAAVLAIQGKDVDIITSSPILACRDAEEWEPFYNIFGLKATSNTEIKLGCGTEPDEERRKCYKHHIVYGTVSNFAADILREEFELKNVRSGRKFDAVIADEVDLLMLDEGVQFTYLSHQSPVLFHVEPVVSTVWAVVGQYTPVTTSYGDVLYMGIPKLFSDTIFESIQAEECKVEESAQFLVIAQQAGLIDEVIVERIMWNDQQATADVSKEECQELKKEAMSTIEIDTIIVLLKKLEDYLPYTFEAYTINANGILELASEVSYIQDVHSDGDVSEEEEKLPLVKILVLPNGLACTLNSQVELQEGSMAKIEASIEFSNERDTEEDQGVPRLKIPLFLKAFVTSQLPIYVNSALRCLEMVENREYAVCGEKIIPVDFRNSGVMQMNKKWGSGLQQILEMKHNLSLSSMSVVTNFLSHVELFSRYKDHGVIFGLSGTLDIDSPGTAKVLFDLFEVRSCVIPTHKRRKFYEKPAITVEGGNSEWFKKIMGIINDAVKKEVWKDGRAVLVLCEDIKTAIELNEYISCEQGYDKKKVHLYARSNSKELQTIQHKFSPGEIAIATNLAGRGTNIQLTDEVKKSGGLLCLVTFLARNRRVELQAFGRSARKGEPGSVQCVLKASALPVQYQGLDMKSIRKLRAEREQIRLEQLLDTEIEEVKLKQMLFKKHCEYLQKINHDIGHQEDKTVTIDAINETWGQWLLMKSDQIERLEEKKLISELIEAHPKWPIRNFYHEIKFGNQLLTESEKNAKQAYDHYTLSIRLEPRYVAIAYYNRAYTIIKMRNKGYMEEAIRDLTEADKCLDSYISEVAYLVQCVPLVKRIKASPSKDSDTTDDEDSDVYDTQNKTKRDHFSAQMQLRIQIFGFFRNKIREAISKITQFQKNNDDIEAEALGIFSLIPDADYITNQELYTMWSLGMEVVFSVKKKPRFCWEGLVVLLIGLAEIAAGVALAVFTVGAAANFGMGLIAEGISDCIDGVVAMATGEFSWAEWGISKAIGITVSLVSGGIAKFAKKGLKGFRVASKLGKEIKAIPKIVKNSWGLAAKSNFKNVMKFVGKTVVQQGIMRGISYGQNAAFEAIFGEIGKNCKEELRSKLHASFTSGKLGHVVDSYYVSQLPQVYVVEDKMSPALRKKCLDFFSEVGNEVVETLVADTYIKEKLTSASLSLLRELSGKHKSGKLVYQTIEGLVMFGVVQKAMDDLEDLLKRLIPETERICQEFTKEEPPPDPVTDVKSYGHLKCAYDLKIELVEFVGDVFGNTVAIFLQQNLGSVANHGMSIIIQNTGGKLLNKMLKMKQTQEAILAGQKANYIRSVDISESTRHIPHISKEMVSHYVAKIADAGQPGSVLELKAAVEHYGQGVVIFQEKGGKYVRDCSIDPPAGTRRGNTIELLYTPPKDHKSAGHYDVIIKGKAVKIKSDGSNCLFQAFAGGLNPGLTSTKESQKQLKQHAVEVRGAAITTINQSPLLWADHISHRLELTQLRNGNRCGLLGAGPKNPKTKVVPELYKELINKNQLHTIYEQVNGVQCDAVRTYEKELQSTRNGCLQTVDGTPLSRMTSIEVHMEGLNSDKNKGRCWDTNPVTGMIKREGGKAKDSAVSYHLCPSEFGANAGNAYANSVMASASYNKMERDMWTPELRQMVGGRDFGMTVKVDTEPLIPNGVKFSDFFKELNNERKSQGKEPIHKTNKRPLEQRLTTITEKDPRAYRIAKAHIEIRVGSETKTFTTNRDTDLYLPSSFTKRNQCFQIPGEELSRAKPKVLSQKFDQPPKYRRKPQQPTTEKRSAFTEKIEGTRKRFKK